ncbi:MAG: polysaccharide pyruvyl transferase CsaB [Cyanobacteriota bacterium]
MIRRPLVCGYYGEHNLGDDALLAALLLQLPTAWQPLVTAHDRDEVEARHGVATVQRRSLKEVLRALRRCDGLVLGGGSLLQDATSLRSLVYYATLIGTARLLDKPVLLWGQGLGPLRRRISRLIARAVLPQAAGITWRDPESQALAERLGVSAASGSDPVWSLPTSPWQGSGGPIVLCWRPTTWLLGERWRPVLHALDQLAQREQREVIWVPFHQEQDRGLLRELTKQGLLPPDLAARSREQPVTTVEEATNLFRRAGLVLAMRLHGLILAALAGSPCAALSYDPKVAVAARALGCPCSDLANLPSTASLQDHWQQQLDQPQAAATLARLQAGTAVHQELLIRFSAL